MHQADLNRVVFYSKEDMAVGFCRYSPPNTYIFNNYKISHKFTTR